MGDSASIAYYKSTNNLPLTSFRIGATPCINPSIQALATGETYYPSQLLPGVCREDSFLGTSTDPRFTESGLNTNVYSMYEVNGVQSFLESLPNYDYHIDNDANMQAKIKSYNRPTIGFSLSCIENGHTRDWAIQTLLKTQAVVEIDNKFFYKMGMTLMIGFSCWIALGLFVHLVALKDESTKRTTEILLWVMYLPSRVSFLCWGTWLAAKSGRDLNQVKDNIDNSDEFTTFNGCVDSYS